MKLLLHHIGQSILDFWLLGLRSGRWWVPVVTLLLGIVAIVATTVQAAVPSAVYVFF